MRPFVPILDPRFGQGHSSRSHLIFGAGSILKARFPQRLLDAKKFESLARRNRR
jgi:hypothetical protein